MHDLLGVLLHVVLYVWTRKMDTICDLTYHVLAQYRCSFTIRLIANQARTLHARLLRLDAMEGQAWLPPRVVNLGCRDT